MYRRVEDFLEDYEGMTTSTLKILDVLTDASLEQEVAAGHRTIRRIGWHIVQTVPEMMNRTGLGLASLTEDSPPPVTAREIADAYRTVTAELKEAVRTNWNDESLLDTDDMYGQSWARGRTLVALLHHEIHHRGQLTVLMRQAGLSVPGAFGPSRDEWASWQMEPPAV